MSQNDVERQGGMEEAVITVSHHLRCNKEAHDLTEV